MTNKLSPKDDLYCLHRHEGLSQRAAWRKAHPDSQASVESIDVMACAKDAEDKIQLRLTELMGMAVDALHCSEEFILNRLAHEGNHAKEGAARVAAWKAMATIRGIMTQDRKNDRPALNTEEIKREMDELLAQRDEITEGDTVH